MSGAALFAALDARPADAPLFNGGDRIWSAAAVRAEIDALAVRLDGCRSLALLADNGPAWAIADLAALRAWSAGDSPRRIAWKAVARSGSDELLVKQFDGAEGGELLLDWHSLPNGLPAESRLSRLTAWVIEADAAGLRWGLHLPGLVIEPGQGPQHRERCLEALALARV